MLCVAAMLLAAGFAVAQVNVRLAWDASADDAGEGENAIQYRLYRCSDEALTACTATETGRALESPVIALTHGQTVWFYATAWRYALAVDGATSSDKLESGKSTVLRVRAFSPPGNPEKSRIQVVEAHSGAMPLVLAAMDR
jgi:hypothetical protein